MLIYTIQCHDQNLANDSSLWLGVHSTSGTVQPKRLGLPDIPVISCLVSSSRNVAESLPLGEVPAL